ncbi:MAG TPA: spherulation-specific family 4 protein [Longimicrobium sp.]|nr:spherulation-specific family 4 protein [Longimicrobium sp.]
MLPSVPTAKVIVVNPNNGRVSTDPYDYTAQIRQAEANGAEVYGYVYTKYANTKIDSLRNPNGAKDRMVDSVKANIDEYYRRYPALTGIFIDEVTDTCGAVGSYYKPIADHIRSHGGKVILNPGGAVPTCYRDLADIVITFENTFDTYKNRWSTVNRGWETNTFSNRIWHIVHTASSAELSEALMLSRLRSAGFIYITDRTFDMLPSYFSTEVANVRAYGSP